MTRHPPRMTQAARWQPTGASARLTPPTGEYAHALHPYMLLGMSYPKSIWIERAAGAG